jgi:hypothetical protein
VKEHVCQVVSKEQLIAYVDGELSPGEAEKITEHIATCPECQAEAEALERSLQVTQAIWQTGRAQWPKTGSFDRIKANRWLFKKVAAIAAGILLLLGVGLTWRQLTKPTPPISEELTAAEIEIKANRAAVAAQMLAVADLFASHPGGEDYAVKRYNYIIESFPGGQESAQASLRLQTLTERRVE